MKQVLSLFTFGIGALLFLEPPRAGGPPSTFRKN
jgi:hypothetical protein